MRTRSNPALAQQAPEARNARERAVGRLQLVLDGLTLMASLVLAAALQPWLRSYWPSLRKAVQFHEHATLVYLALPLWLVLIVTFRVHLALPHRLGQAELLVRLIKLHLAGLAGVSLLQFLTQSVINRSLVGLFFVCTFVLMHLQRTVLITWARYQDRTGNGRERVLLVGRPCRRTSELVQSALA
ncbi:MAG: hypothetical protein ABW321_04770, partial [Polyangiales bacterium]